MRIAVVGATGFVGRALVLRLVGEGHHVLAVARDPARARRQLPAAVAVTGLDELALRAAVRDADAVVNLAGEPIAGRRWTRARRTALRASRIDLTRRVAEAIAARPRALPVLVNASAVGWYGDRGDEPLAEDVGPGAGFAAELCRDWEAAAEATRNVTRIVRARLGVVLGLGGGALVALARLHRLGLGGPIAGGRHWVPWIHLDDAIAVLARAVVDVRLAGPVNVVAPGAVRQRDFAHELGRVLRRPAIVPTPLAALRLALGRAAALITASQRVVPRALTTAGFRFRFPALDFALADLVGRTGAVSVEPVDAAHLPPACYLRDRRPTHTLRAETTVAAPIAEVFAFFAAAENLAALTPPELGFAITSPRPIAMRAGTTIDYRIRIAGLPVRWRTSIEVWRPGRMLVDSQLRGPYRAWWHEHRFHADGDRTIMEDVVHYAAPLGALGRLANALVVAPMLRRIFAYRRQAIHARFGARPVRACAAEAPAISLVEAPAP
jgi:uncharacterized protein (TIGR01777 family)